MSVDRSWRHVGVVGGWQVVASTTYYAVFAATAAIAGAFEVSTTGIGILLAVLTLGYTVMLFPAGAIVDGYGDRPPMVVGLALLAVGTVGVGVAPSFAALLVAVFVLGAAYATAMPATNRAIADRAPPGQYNLAVGVKQIGVTTGSALAAVVVTNAARVGATWRTAFLAIGAVAGLAAMGYLVAYRGTGGTGRPTLPDVRGLWDDRSFVFLSLAGLFLGTGIFTTTGYLVPFLESADASVHLAGFALATMQISGSAGRIGVGAIADRLPGSAAAGAARVMLAQLGTAAALYLALPLVGVAAAFPLVAVLGLSMLGTTGLYHGTLVRLVDDDEAGAATAAGQTTINLGGLLAPPAFGVLVDAAGYTMGWWLLAVGSVLGVGALALSVRSLGGQ
ncbi:MAG: MFS transporter [Halanaeroarchaeum sp.]